MKKNILIFTPHPDDHISCAGTLFKLIAGARARIRT